ncbi:succinate--CoA ligase subunit alpha [Desulfurispora thermophila]|uniref:succinate--CoA ligase subunit alpha n=1 Tax=Desulfurispora thermophila TaxID=265470 RepID=UPI0003699A14|nr:succinate--CoA ligase subunit alpha [Desulfurispora thermophila]
MAIIIDENTHVLVQGITGNQGRFHTRQMLNFGTKIVAGVSPGKGGQEVEGVPVYDTVSAALEEQKVDAACLFIPAAFAKDAAFEAIDAGIKVVVIITEHIPVHDEMQIIAFARQKGTTIIGPNTFGIVSAGKCKIGIPPNQFFKPGPVGVVARSGTLTYEIVANLSAHELGQSTVVGLGGDRVVGLSFIDVLERFEKDPETKAVVLVGEIGGNAEEEAAEFIKKMSKPVVAYIAGKSAPPGKRMGHAGAIIERGKGTFEGKVKALQAAGVAVATLPFEVPGLIKQALG